MNEEQHSTAHWRHGLLKKAGVVAGFALTGVGIGNQVGSDSDIIGFEVKTRMTIGTDATVGFGKENIRYDMGLPLDAGAHIEPQTLSPEAFADELRQVGDLETAIEPLSSDLMKHLGTYGLIGSFVGGAWLLARKRPQDLKSAVVGTAAATSLGMGVGLPSAELHSHEWQKLNQNAFEGQIPGEIVSKLSVSSAGNLLVQIARSLDTNERFYDGARSSAIAAVKPAVEYSKQANTTMILLETDWHCRFGSARISEAIADEISTKIVLNAGDLVQSGYTLEKACVDIYDKYVGGSDRQIIIAPGNHDGVENVNDMKKAGWKVLEGETIDVDGLSIYGDSDPRVEKTASPGVSRNPKETDKLFRLRISEDIAAEDPDIVLIHDKKFVDKDSVGEGTLVLSGHMHKTEINPNGQWIQGGTSGGKQENTVSYYNGFDADAQYQILHQDKTTKKFIGVHVLTINTKGKASLSEVFALPSVKSSDIPPQLMK